MDWLKTFLEIEWKAIWQAPKTFLAVVALSLGVAYLVFSVILSEKDATIQKLALRPTSEEMTKATEKIHQLEAELKKLPPIYADFSPVYEMYKSELGDPAGLVQTSDDAYQGAFQNATALWLDATSRIYFLPNELKHMTVVERADILPTLDEKYFDEKTLRHLFPQCVSPLLPPSGGVAGLLRRIPQDKWIGCAIWQCGFSHRTVHYQDFQKGAIVGPFRVALHVSETQAFVLLRDGRFFAGHTRAPAPVCDPILRGKMTFGAIAATEF